MSIKKRGHERISKVRAHHDRSWHVTIGRRSKRSEPTYRFLLKASILSRGVSHRSVRGGVAVGTYFITLAARCQKRAHGRQISIRQDMLRLKISMVKCVKPHGLRNFRGRLHLSHLSQGGGKSKTARSGHTYVPGTRPSQGRELSTRPSPNVQDSIHDLDPETVKSGRCDRISLAFWRRYAYHSRFAIVFPTDHCSFLIYIYPSAVP